MTDSTYYAVHGQRLKLTLNRHWRTAARSIRLTKLHYLKLYGGYFAVFPYNLGGIGEEFEGYPLLYCLLNLNILRRHLITGAAINYIYVFGAHCGATRVHGGVSSAHNGNVFTQTRRLAECDFTQKFNSAHNAIQLLALAAKTHIAPCSDGDNNGVIP